jgi:hypothetical protein
VAYSTLTASSHRGYGNRKRKKKRKSKNPYSGTRSTPNSILGGRGVRRTQRARRSYDRARVRSRVPQRVSAPTLKARRDYLADRADALSAAIERRTSPRTAFDPSLTLRARTPEQKVPKLERRLERVRAEQNKVAAELHERRSKQAAKDDPSTLTALEYASLGLPGVGLVTGGGRLLGVAGAKAVLGGLKGARAASRGAVARSKESTRTLDDLVAASKNARKGPKAARSRSPEAVRARARQRAAGSRPNGRPNLLSRPQAARVNQTLQRVGRGRSPYKGALSKAARDANALKELRKTRVVAGAVGRGAARGVGKAAGKTAKGTAKAATYPLRHPIKASKADVRAQAPLYAATEGADVDNPVLNVLQTPRYLAEAAKDDPGQFAKNTLTGTRDILMGIPPALYESGAAIKEGVFEGDWDRGENLLNLMGQDFSARYGPIVEGDTEKLKQVVNEGYTITDPETGEDIHVPGGGAAAYVLDAMIAGPPAGRALGAAARRGALGPGLQRFATRQRAPLRRSGGDESVKIRQPSRNLFGLAGQRAGDRARLGITRRRSARGDAISREALKKGQITPVLRGRKAKKFAAGIKGRAQLAGRMAGAEVVGRGLVREFHRDLTKAEQRGWRPALALGPVDAEQAVRVLRTRIKDINEERGLLVEEHALRDVEQEVLGEGGPQALAEFRQLPEAERLEIADDMGVLDDVRKTLERKLWPKAVDNIPEYEALIRDADKVFTPNLRAWADRQRARGFDVADLDPSIKEEQALLRAAQQQASVLGVEQFQFVTRAEFERSFSRAKEGEFGVFLDDLPADLPKSAELFLSKDGRVGGMLYPAKDGKTEAKLLFNGPPRGPRGAGEDLLDLLIARGVTRVDNIGDDLRRKYERHGFRVTKTYKFDPEQAPAGWDAYVAAHPGVDPTPNVYVMERPEGPQLRSTAADLEAAQVPVPPEGGRLAPIAVQQKLEIEGTTRRTDGGPDGVQQFMGTKTFRTRREAGDESVRMRAEAREKLGIKNPKSDMSVVAGTTKRGERKFVAFVEVRKERLAEFEDGSSDGAGARPKLDELVTKADTELPDEVLARVAGFDGEQLQRVRTRQRFIVDEVEPGFDTRVKVGIEPNLYPNIGRIERENIGGGHTSEFYDKTIAEPNPKGYPVLKEGTAYSRDIPFEKEEGFIYRGVHADELAFIRKEGKIKSNGEYNIADVQAGTTLFSPDPRTASSYAASFAPPHAKPSFDAPGYILKVRRAGLKEKPEASPSNEVAVVGDIPESAIVEVAEVRPFAMSRGEMDIREAPYDAPPGQYLRGGGRQPQAQYAYRKSHIREVFRGKPSEDFLARLQKRREEEGFAEPGYAPSQIRRDRPDFSVHGAGGRGAVHPSRAYTGWLYNLGIEDTRLHIMAEAYLRNIKRSTNWNLVADVWERTTLPWSRNKSMSELLIAIQREGLDEGNLVFVNVNKLRNARVNLDRDVFNDKQLSLDIDHLGSEPLQAAVNDASMSFVEAEQRAANVRGHSTLADDFENDTGWALMDKAAYDEITSGMKATALGRVANIVLTQKPSRIILGSLNVPWLKFQVMSNAFMTGIVGGVGPVDWVKSALWYRGLSDAQKKAVAPYLGDGSHFFPEESKLGAASTNRLVNAYRAMKETIGGKVIWTGDKRILQTRDFNPFNVMFGADRAQNNFFRRAVLYNRLKREAYQNMGDSAGQLGVLQNRLMDYLSLGPKQQMRAMLDDVKLIERHAETVNELLGDYTTFTAIERMGLKRYVMFYSFIRFSLRLAFYTMPVKHPVMSGILGNLAKLEAAEIQELLGGDILPYALGRYYMDEGQMMVDLSRANPTLNALTQTILGPGAQGQTSGFVGLLSPWFGAAYSQVAQEEAFTGKDWTVNGEPIPREKQGIGLFDPVRAEIAANDFLTMFYPYRVADEIVRGGRPVGADHLLFSPSFTKYSPETMASIRQSSRKQERALAEPFLGVGGLGGRVLREVFPELPQPSRDVEVARGLREAVASEREQTGQKKKKRTSGSSGWSLGGSSGGGSLGGWRLGGS